MSRHASSLSAIVIAVPLTIVIASAGCNTVLGNEEGTLRVTTEAGTPDVTTPGNVDGGGPTCDTAHGNKICFGLCVGTKETSTGCGDPASCKACDPENVLAAQCEGGATGFVCGFTDCKPGFASCDTNRANGCETSLNSKDSCGGCGTKCEGATPFCAAQGNGYQCVASCPPDTTDCSGACVDTQKALNHCGKCENKCARASATATCNAGTCEYQCNPGTHECNQQCVSNVDPEACGASCTKCGTPPNTIPTCTNGTCGTLCAAGYIDCDGNQSNGCEQPGLICRIEVTCGLSGVDCLSPLRCCIDKCIDPKEPCAVPNF